MADEAEEAALGNTKPSSILCSHPFRCRPRTNGQFVEAQRGSDESEEHPAEGDAQGGVVNTKPSRILATPIHSGAPSANS